MKEKKDNRWFKYAKTCTVVSECRIYVAKGGINVFLAENKCPMSVCFHIWTRKRSLCQLYGSAN